MVRTRPTLGEGSAHLVGALSVPIDQWILNTTWKQPVTYCVAWQSGSLTVGAIRIGCQLPIGLAQARVSVARLYRDGDRDPANVYTLVPIRDFPSPTVAGETCFRATHLRF